jgi:hypothetical protein
MLYCSDGNGSNRKISMTLYVVLWRDVGLIDNTYTAQYLLDLDSVYREWSEEDLG